MNIFMMLSILIPLCFGAIMLILRPLRTRLITCIALCLTLIAAIAVSCCVPNGAIQLAAFSSFLSLELASDALAQFLMILIAVVFLAAMIFAFQYMRHDEHNGKFFGFCLLTLGCLMGLCLASNLLTFYMFYEAMTLASFPLILYTNTDKARKAAFKYLGFSIFGAGLALAGMMLCGTDIMGAFTPNGMALLKGENDVLGYLLIALGFSCKAGMYPLSQWLPTAHPEAPAPASAILSGIITKAGILGVIRVTFFVFGADTIRGTYAQTVMLILALLTIFIGSMLAYKEKLLKKRLAYSSVSQLSYVLLGLMLLNPQGFCGAMLQVLFHAAAKTGLFLCAGAIIHQTSTVRIDEMFGMGKRMPIVMCCFTLLSLSLIGIPPLGGFNAKWELLTGAAQYSGILGAAGMIILLISALLTALYLLPIVYDSFFSSRSRLEKSEPNALMTIPIAALSAFVLIAGMFPNIFKTLITEIAGGLFI